MRKLAEKSRARWPQWAEPVVRARPAREEEAGGQGRRLAADGLAAPAAVERRSRSATVGPSSVVVGSAGAVVVGVVVLGHDPAFLQRRRRRP